MLADDPLLTVRLPGMERRRPLRIVLDSRARLPLRSRLVATAGDWPVLAVVGEHASADAVRGLKAAGVRVHTALIGAEGRLDPECVLRSMAAEYGLSRIFCEGGPTLANRLLVARLVDEAILFDAPTPLGRPGLAALNQAAQAILRSSYAATDGGFAGADRWQSFERIA
jgi:diaminohydroxyphosphoribosylaminopyrimidine deaminase/5-amino-6-(5-phosphoribosylamino)uracil reductase